MSPESIYKRTEQYHCPQKKTKVRLPHSQRFFGPFSRRQALHPWAAPRPARGSREPAPLHPPGSCGEPLGGQRESGRGRCTSIRALGLQRGARERRKKGRKKGKKLTGHSAHLPPAAFGKQIEGNKAGPRQTIRHLLSRPSEDDRHPPCGPGGSPEPGTPQEGQSSGAASSKGAIKALGKINAKGTAPKSASCNMPASCSRPGKLPDL